MDFYAFWHDRLYQRKEGMEKEGAIFQYFSVISWNFSRFSKNPKISQKRTKPRAFVPFSTLVDLVKSDFQNGTF